MPNLSNFIRRIVSANKSRFKDDELKLELDLVYVTDRIIIMGYPATGIEGLYRNRREDAIYFLQHRHGQNYWIFNFCPLTENSYDPAVFGGRVSRYPFPDHHAPPFAILPLVTREIDTWLGCSEDRVAVLHCKAGKGRSGTITCAYLLAHQRAPSPPKLQRSYSTNEWAKRQIQETIDILPLQEGESTVTSSPVTSQPATPVSECPLGSLYEKGVLDVEKAIALPASSVDPVANTEIAFTDAVKAVLDLHTARRMKISTQGDPGTSGKQTKQGVSIPSQRRFLYYWALVLAQQAPNCIWPVERTENIQDNEASPFRRLCVSKPKVRLTQIKLRMRDSSKVAVGIVKAANTVIDKTNRSRSSSIETKGVKEKAWASSSQIWASLARYNDGLVDLLEDWEAHTRGASGDMTKRRLESMTLNRDGFPERLDEIFNDGKWDKQKMVSSFAKLGVIDRKIEKGINSKDAEIRVYTLRPLATNGTLKQDGTTENDHAPSQTDVAPSNDLSPTSAFKGIELDAGREVRVKLFMGQIFMGWAWFIPAFHMPHPPLSPGASSQTSSSLKTTFLLRRDDIDFALGVGNAIIDVEFEMESVIPLQ